MGIGDIFKATKNRELETRVAELEALLTPEQTELDAIQKNIAQAQKEMLSIQKELDKLKKNKDSVESEIHSLQKQLIETNDEILMQSFSLYTPHFQFTTAEKYKNELDKIRKKEKDMIREGAAATGNMNWNVNGSSSQGKKMVKDMQKLLIRAFNSECDDCVEHVKFNNIETMIKRIQSSYEAISKLGSVMSISINPAYLNLKLKEIYLAFEYQQKKQEEKEHLKQLRAEERERIKLEKEIEEARKKLEKEQKHFTAAIASVDTQLLKATDPNEISALHQKKLELQQHIADLDKARAEVDYRAANQKAGYVYIISNIGAFGEGVYKIGMTRRLDPMDRIDELGDASVPFNFDVHALIFSDDAPALEAALHHSFENKKVNMINHRREFFRVSIEEIKQVVYANFDKTVDFIDIAPAEQYRQSLAIQKSGR